MEVLWDIHGISHLVSSNVAGKSPHCCSIIFRMKPPVFDADFPAKNGCAEPKNHDVCECSRIVRFSCAIIWQQRSGSALQKSSILNAIMLMLLRAQLG